MNNTGYEINVVGEPVKSGGWYNGHNGLHTVVIYPNALHGKISIEASLALEPLDTDWFSVPLDGNHTIEFPRNPSIPNETHAVGYTFQGKYLWVRAILDRSYILDDMAGEREVTLFGTINRIVLCF